MFPTLEVFNKQDARLQQSSLDPAEAWSSTAQSTAVWLLHGMHRATHRDPKAPRTCMPLMRSSSWDTASRAPSTSAASSVFCFRSCCASACAAAAASCRDKATIR
jgi:hypothetical protein